MKGIFEFEVLGITRGFKFGTYAIGIAQERENTTLDELFNRIGQGRKPKVSVMALTNLFYGAAVHYCQWKRIETDFTPSDVADWLDEIGLDKTNEMLSKGLEQFIPKNSESLSPEKRESQPITQ